jgi:hypothetical protein
VVGRSTKGAGVNSLASSGLAQPLLPQTNITTLRSLRVSGGWVGVFGGRGQGKRKLRGEHRERGEDRKKAVGRRTVPTHHPGTVVV